MTEIKKAHRAYMKWLAAHIDKFDPDTRRSAEILRDALWAMCQRGAPESLVMRESTLQWARELEDRLGHTHDESSRSR